MIPTLETKIHIPDEIVLAELEDEAVILNQKTGKYYGLTDTGFRMWQLSTHYGELLKAYNTLFDEYQVTGERLQQDLIRFIEKLASKKLIEIDDS